MLRGSRRSRCTTEKRPDYLTASCWHRIPGVIKLVHHFFATFNRFTRFVENGMLFGRIFRGFCQLKIMFTCVDLFDRNLCWYTFHGACEEGKGE